MLVIVINCLRLFALSFIFTMEIDTRVQCITAIHTTSRMLTIVGERERSN